MNRPDEFITGRRSQDTTARCQGDGHNQIEAMWRASGNPVSNNLEQMATNSVTRSNVVEKMRKSVVSKLDRIDRHQGRPCVQVDSRIFKHVRYRSNSKKKGDTDLSNPTSLPLPESKPSAFEDLFFQSASAPWVFLILFPVQRSTVHFDSDANLMFLHSLTLTDAFVHFHVIVTATFKLVHLD